MKVTKYMEGQLVELVFDKIKNYGRYTMYQVSKVFNGVKTPLYRECFSDYQKKEIKRNNYRIIQVEGNERL